WRAAVLTHAAHDEIWIVAADERHRIGEAGKTTTGDGGTEHIVGCHFGRAVDACEPIEHFPWAREPYVHVVMRTVLWRAESERGPTQDRAEQTEDASVPHVLLLYRQRARDALVVDGGRVHPCGHALSREAHDVAGFTNTCGCDEYQIVVGMAVDVTN